jgi:hypothetical protein
VTSHSYPIVNEAWVRGQAMGALTWIDGYTESGSGEFQYKIKDISRDDDEVMTVTVEPADRFGPSPIADEPVRRFTIDVVVRRVF